MCFSSFVSAPLGWADKRQYAGRASRRRTPPGARSVTSGGQAAGLDLTPCDALLGAAKIEEQLLRAYAAGDGLRLPLGEFLRLLGFQVLDFRHSVVLLRHASPPASRRPTIGHPLISSGAGAGLPVRNTTPGCLL